MDLFISTAFSFVLQQCGMNPDDCPKVETFSNSSGNSSSDVEECNTEVRRILILLFNY